MSQVQRSTPGWMIAVVCLLLGTLTALVYGRMVWDKHDFVLYDDHLYVLFNPDVLPGLSWSGVLKAFRFDSIVAANWHPLTMLSHMLDCQIYGVQGWGHHLTSLLWHTAATMLLFLLLMRMTGHLWASAGVAALFAWHPLHVESVAWVSERKDVMSAFFWFLATWFYVSWVRRPHWLPYVLMCSSMLLGVLSKPMVVTLPFVLLLLDFWPLGRLGEFDLKTAATWRRFGQRVLEKAPLFLLVVFDAVVTFIVQRDEAMAPLAAVPFAPRVVNVLMSYNAYIASMLWPIDLVVPYHLEYRALSILQAILGGFGILLVTSIVYALRRPAPYLLVGWLWYLGTLVPVIGFVQVGVQYMADRYSYIPLVGLFLAVVFGLAAWAQGRPRVQPVVATVSVGVLAVLFVLTYWQVGYWKNTELLFGHTIAKDKRNHSAHVAIGSWYMSRHQPKEALQHFEEALRLSPNTAMARLDRGLALRDLKRYDEAILDFQKAIDLGNPKAAVDVEIAKCYFAMQKYDEARRYFEETLQETKDAGVYAGLGLVAGRQGRVDDAVACLKKALELNPHLTLMKVILSRIYAASDDPRRRNAAEAVRLAEEACKQTQNTNPLALDTLAIALAEAGRFDEARETALKAKAVARRQRKEPLVAAIEQHYDLFLVDRRYREDPATFDYERYENQSPPTAPESEAQPQPKLSSERPEEAIPRAIE